MHSDCQDVLVLGDREGSHRTATCGELILAGTRVGRHCHCYKSGAVPERRGHRERSGRQMRRWRRGHVVEGDRSCPDSVVEGGAEYVQGGERGERGKRQSNLNEASLT